MININLKIFTPVQKMEHVDEYTPSKLWTIQNQLTNQNLKKGQRLVSQTTNDPSACVQLRASIITYF